MTWREQLGWKRITGGGVQNRFWRGFFWYVFPSPDFSTPFAFFSEESLGHDTTWGGTKRMGVGKRTREHTLPKKSRKPSKRASGLLKLSQLWTFVEEKTEK